MKKWFLYVVLALTLSNCIPDPPPKLANTRIDLYITVYHESGRTAKKRELYSHFTNVYIKELNKNYSIYEGEYSLNSGSPQRMPAGEYTIIVGSTQLRYTSAETRVSIKEGIDNRLEIEVFELAKPKISMDKVHLVEKTEVLAKGSVHILGDVSVQEYGFCFSTENAEPTIEDTKVFLTDKRNKGEFELKIQNLQENERYFIRSYATNKYGVSYGDVVEFVPMTPPIVSKDLLVYYTFDNANCNNYLQVKKFDGLLNGTGEPPTFVTDMPNDKGKVMRCISEKFYILRQAPKYNHSAATMSVWIKTTSSSEGVICYTHGGFQILLKNYHVAPFNVDLTTTLFDGNWHHLVVTRFYKDYNIDTDRYYNAYADLYIDGKYFMQEKFYDGGINKGGQGHIGFGYTGLMDNLRIYNRALTIEEIREIYQAKQ